MRKSLSEQLRDILGEVKEREAPNLIFMPKAEAERIAKEAGVKLSDVQCQVVTGDEKQNIFEVEDENA
jgi:hypothetical protein